MKTRQADFEGWQNAHPDAQMRVEKLMRRTAQRVPKTVRGTVNSSPVVFRLIGSLMEFWDAPLAPRLTIISAGEFTMGSPEWEPDRQIGEGPQHRVLISRPFAAGTYLVTRDEYAWFVADTKRPDPDGCYLTHVAGQKGETKGYNWHNPGFEQTGSDPAVCVSWQDAHDYAAWLTEKTGRHYRLLSEAEWEYVARAGSATARPWGDAISHINANYRADACCNAQSGVTGDDPWQFTSPVGSFPPNAFGLYDALGNVWQRLDDCWTANHDGAPTDGSARTDGDCNKRTGHGGAFDAAPTYLRSAFRGSVPLATHFSDGGFRIARDL
jgi:formylglycine-generating enzyme required for sulfatase activity